MSRRKPRRWHRRIAGYAVAIVLWFALSGIVLNHAHDLALDQRPLPAALTRLFYSTPLPAHLAGFRLDDHWLFALDHTLYDLDDAARAIGPCAGGVRGAVRFGDWHAAACGDAVYIVDAGGNRVERIDAAWGLAGDVTALAVPAGTTMLGIGTKDATWCIDAALAALQRCSARIPAPATATPLPPDARDTLAAVLAPPAIDDERFVHDLHSGRLFGAAARWAWDLFALALLALAGSGLLLLRRRERRA